MTATADKRRVLTDADHGRIDALAAKGWKPARIAQVIGQKGGTVYWYMLNNGMVERPVRSASAPELKPYKRGDRWVYPYSAAEDDFIEGLRAETCSFGDIAKRATERFGNPRTAHSIRNRLTMLAAVSK